MNEQPTPDEIAADVRRRAIEAIADTLKKNNVPCHPTLPEYILNGFYWHGLKVVAALGERGGSHE